MTRRGAARVMIAAAAAAGFAVAGAWSLRLARADYWFGQETVASTAKALEFTPDQSEYLVRLALLVGDQDPARALAALRQAVKLNPNDGRAWVEQGLRLEEAGDLVGAESALLTAADIDETYLPRWTLLNYYFRRNNADRFWYWAKAAVPMIYGDPVPLFHLCGRVEEDGRLIGRLDIRQPEIQSAYVFYLLDSGHADLAGSASRDVLAGKRKEDVPLLLEACDRLIDAGRIEDSEAIWDGLAHSGRLTLPPRIEPAPILTDGDFAVSPVGHGYDWRLPELEGISASREDGAAGLRLTFSGMQAEAAEPLLQFVRVEEDAAYQLRYSYRNSDIGAESGLAWCVTGMNGERIAESRELTPGETADGIMPFVTPPGCRVVRLSLEYRRRPGTTRIAGYLVLRGVQMQLRPTSGKQTGS